MDGLGWWLSMLFEIYKLEHSACWVLFQFIEYPDWWLWWVGPMDGLMSQLPLEGLNQLTSSFLSRPLHRLHWGWLQPGRVKWTAPKMGLQYHPLSSSYAFFYFFLQMRSWWTQLNKCPYVVVGFVLKANQTQFKLELLPGWFGLN